MNQVHDKLAGEIPFDAVSNLINETITRYEDGKDQGLVGGQVSIDKKNDAIDRFYERLKSDINTFKGETNLKEERLATVIGGHIISKDGDILVKASESISPNSEDITGIGKISSSDIVGQKRLLVSEINSEIYETYAVKINKEVSDKAKMLKNIMDKFLDKIAITSNYSIGVAKGDRKDFVVTKLKSSDKKILIPVSYSNFRDFIKDGVAAFAVSNINFYKEYYLKVSTIIDILVDYLQRLDDIFERSLKYSGDKFQQFVEDVKEYNSLNYNDFYSFVARLDNEAMLPVYMKLKNINVVEDTFEDVDVGKPADISIRALVFYLSSLSHLINKGSVGKFLELATQCALKEIKKKVLELSPRVIKNIEENGWRSISIATFLDDITIGEFYDISRALIESGNDTKKYASKTIQDCTRVISRSCDKLASLCISSAVHIKQYGSKIAKDNPDRLLSMMHMIRGKVLTDALDVLSILYALVAFDIYPRLDLYNAYCQTISVIENSIESGE